jgi:hypothetical protein
MKSRSELGKLYQAHHKTGYGAEIGVKEGWNSKNISKYWTGHTYLIDTWSASDLERMQVLINMHGYLYSIIQYDSVRASRLFDQAHLDWVYIDGGHEYEQVKADHWAYYHVVRKGGIISGHDYSPDFPGVCRMVDELIAEGHEIQFTTDDIYNGIPYQTWWYVR